MTGEEAPATGSVRQPHSRAITKTLLGVVLGGVCLWLALRDVDAGELARVLRGAGFGWLALAGALLMLSYGVRAVRWAVILGVTPVAQLVVLYWAVGVGYLLNSVLPARAGDVARSVVAGRSLSISMPRVFASTIVERFVDAGALALALVLAVPFVGSLPPWLLLSAQLVGAVSLVAAGVLVLVARRSRRGSGQRDRAVPERSPVRAAVASFGSGLLLIDSVPKACRVLTATSVVWAVDVLIAMSLARAFGVDLGPLESLVLLAAFGLASAAPSTPGFVGVFQAVAVAVLVPFGSSPEAAIAIATALQFVTLGTALLASVLGAALGNGDAGTQPESGGPENRGDLVGRGVEAG